MNLFLEAAKAYLSAGFSPFPVEPKGKRPITAWRQYADTPPTVEQLERWWAATPTANVGLALRRGQWVLDVDSDEGFAAVEAAGHRLLGQHVNTGKGWHFYFKGDAPNGVAVLPGVDTRGYGGFVVAPPSRHASGRQYTGAPYLSEPSPQLLAIIATSKKPRVAETAVQLADPIIAWANGIAEGGRDIACTRAAGKLLGLGLHPDAVEALLLPGAERCSPPFEDVAKCVNSIAKKEDAAVVDEEDRPEGGPAIVAFVERLLSPEPPKRVVSTGLDRLDEALNGGLYPGQATYFAGIGGVGKSITAQALAIQSAQSGAPVIYATLEMPEADVMVRLLSHYMFLDSRHLLAILHGQVKADEMDIRRIRGVVPVLQDLPLTIRQSWQTVAALDKALAQRPETRLLVVDQVHHLRHPDGSTGMHGLEANSRALVELAGKYDIPIVGLCQVNRPEGKERNRDWRPTRYSLRGSEQLYHDPAVVLLFHRTEDAPERVEIQIAKGRMGGASDAWLSFQYRPQYCRVGGE